MYSIVWLYRVPETQPPEEEGGSETEGDDPGTTEDIEEKVEAANNDIEDDEPGMWEETFKTHTDSKPYGQFPESST